MRSEEKKSLSGCHELREPEACVRPAIAHWNRPREPRGLDEFEDVTRDKTGGKPFSSLTFRMTLLKDRHRPPRREQFWERYLGWATRLLRRGSVALSTPHTAKASTMGAATMARTMEAVTASRPREPHRAEGATRRRSGARRLSTQKELVFREPFSKARARASP
mmetsp:Transcript_13467/g.35830  ORF Transcript_13467/g.35830 Transcript_13467/m.35830 type:complete len:164 (+) Transcript_13467:787-1278(+)